ncbi:helix-turn-helix domain-containing protein [Parapedobacter lycopersici]|uniref:helix-turn-helix domain-containing protein n=1 Tax=Parapedobacter lycopersici TaxID=1864939 RepID=UPI00214D8B9A|nr:AraC family transcriptional regulator [Parapedobacter lycopersici]
MHVKFYDSDPLLKAHILMFAYAELSAEELSKTKFLPDNATSLTLFLNTDPSVTDYFTGNTVAYRVAFAGQHSVSVCYTPREHIRIINVDFLPWGAYSVFGLEQAALHNVTSDATELFPGLKDFMPELESHLHDEDHCLRVIEQFLLAELKKRTRYADERIINACRQITESRGNLQIRELCSTVGMSHSGLTRYFSEMIGVTPKIFGRVARFTAVQKFLGENPDAGWGDIVHQFDYFDQNHFIREFKQFTGAVPKDRRQWEALFDPLKKAMEEGFATDAEQMQRYRDTSLYQILHYIQRNA